MILLRLIENYALNAGCSELLINAAHGAKPFFRKSGYEDKTDGFLGKLIVERNSIDKTIIFTEDMLSAGIYQGLSH